MPKFVANWLIQGHRGKDIVGGSTVSMSEDDAAPLLQCGALSPADRKSDGEPVVEPAAEQEAEVQTTEPAAEQQPE